MDENIFRPKCFQVFFELTNCVCGVVIQALKNYLGSNVRSRTPVLQCFSLTMFHIKIFVHIDEVENIFL